MKAANVAILLLHAAAVTWMTWPLLPEAGHAVLDLAPVTRADVGYAMWALGWIAHALGTAPWMVVQANVYHPSPDALAYGPPGFGVAPVFVPAFMLSDSPVVGVNAVLLVHWLVGAIGLQRWVQRDAGDRIAGVIAGWSWLALPTTLGVASMPQYAALAWLPWLLLELGGRARIVVLVPLAILTALTDAVYVAPVVLAAFGTCALVVRREPNGRAVALRVLSALALTAVALAPVYLPYLRVRAANPDLLAQSVWRTGTPADLDVVAPLGISPFVWVLALVSGAVRDRGWWIAVVFAVVGWVAVPLLPWVAPFARAAERAGYPAAIAVAALAGRGVAVALAWLVDPARGGLPRWPTRVGLGGLAAGACALVAIDGRSPEGGLRPVAWPPAHADVLARGTGPVLELPVGSMGTAPAFHVRAMLASTRHHRPVVNGYGSYWPAPFRERMQWAHVLPDPGALATLRRLVGLSTIVAHLDDLSGPQREPWLALAQHPRAGLTLVHRDATTLIFDVDGLP